MSTLKGPEVVDYIRARIDNVREFSDGPDDLDDLDDILDDARARATWMGRQRDLAIAGEWFPDKTAPEGPWTK